MSEPLPDFVPANDEELYVIIRDITGYGTGVDQQTLDSQLRIAKMRLYNKTKRTDFYESTALAQVLTGFTAMLTKSTVENISLQGYSIGDESLQFKDYSENQIMDLWATLVAEAMKELQGSQTGMRNTSSYVGGKPVRRDSTNHYTNW